MVFLGSFLQYLIIMVILGLIAFAGLKIGVTMAKNKNKKEEAADSKTTDSLE